MKNVRFVSILAISSLLSACGSNNLIDEPISEVSQSSDKLHTLNYWQGVRTTATGSNIAAYYNSSVANYGYTGAFDAARTAWSGISSKVNIAKSTTFVNTNDTYIVDGAADPDAYGRVFPYKSNGSGGFITATVDESWHHANLAIYNGSIAQDYPGLDSEKRQTVLHEVGHTIKMAHTTETTASNSVMYGGKADGNGTRSSFSVTAYDRGEVIQKWGQ